MDAATLPTCYRHDDRETRLACSSCERPICVDCTRTAAVGQKCPECAAPAKGARTITAGELYGGTLRQRAPVTFAVIVACVGAFVLSSVQPQVTALGLQDNALVAQGQWWRLVTAALLHASLPHILFNMYALYLFGPPLERLGGSVAFAALFVGSAAAGGATFYGLDALGLVGGGRAVGASGAVFGLFGAMLVETYRRRSTPAGQAGLRQLLTLLAINMALPLLLPFIAWQAHLGGLVAGALVAASWGDARGAQGPRVAVGVAVGLVAVAVTFVL